MINENTSIKIITHVMQNKYYYTDLSNRIQSTTYVYYVVLLFNTTPTKLLFKLRKSISDNSRSQKFNLSKIAEKRALFSKCFFFH